MSRKAKSDVDDVNALLSELTERGFHLRLDGEALRYTAPQGALTPDLRTRLQALKPAVMERLRQADAAPLPASLTQRRFWALQQLDPDWAFYNVPFLFQIHGPLDTGLLRQAVDSVVARHDSLRTTLHQRDGALVQIVADKGHADWVQTDMRGAPDGAVDDLLRREAMRRFDLQAEPCLRVTLVWTEDDAHLFQIVLHNVVFDLASVLVILDEISAHYTALAAGRAADLPAPVQYAEYVRWQAARVAAGMERRRAYWQNWLAQGEQPGWAWPVPAQPAAQPDFNSVPTWHRLPPPRLAALQAFCRARGVTVYIALLTAYLLATRDLTQCDDLTIGTTYSDRDAHRFASMIGASIMVPALRVDMSDNPPLPALLTRVREVVAGAVEYQDLPIEEVVPRDSKGPLFKLVCTWFAETPHGRLRLPGIRSTWQETWWNPISRPTLYLVVWEMPTPNGPSLTCHMMHRRDMWDADTAQRMMQRFQSILDGMADV
jgi:hypothetical protein